MGQTPTSNTGTYVYCVARAQPCEKGGWPFTTPGIGGRAKAVRIVTYDDLAAVVSDAAQGDYDVTRENLLAHQRVITQAMTRSDVLAVETRVNENQIDLMLLNAAFLVDKSQEQAFDATVQALGEGQAGRQIFQYVGPLPPYNFVDLELRWEEEPDGAAV